MKTKIIALMGALMLSNAYSAQTLNYDINLVSVGTVSPASLNSWGSVTLTELTDNSVLLTVSSNLVNSEFYSSAAFNLIDSFAFTTVTFDNYTSSGQFDAPSITIGNNIASGGAGVNYDLLFEFTTTGSGGGSHRFNGNDSFSYTLNGININAFDQPANPFILHAQGIAIPDGTTSAWVKGDLVGTSQVPEPTSILLGSIGMLALLTNRKRQYA